MSNVDIYSYACYAHRQNPMKHISILAAAFFIYCSPTHSNPMQNEVSVQTGIITSPENTNVAIEVYAISKNQGGWIIAGGLTATKQAWAAAVDDHGAKRWEYTRGLLEDDKPHLANRLSTRPEFRSAVSVPGGSHYLCGSMPRRQSSPTAALLTILDDAGKPRRERLIYSATETAELSASLGHCLYSHGIIVGIGFKSFGFGKDEYWITGFDLDGATRWEKTFSAKGANPIFAIQEIATLAVGDNIVVSATDNTKTDVFILSPQGILVAHRSMSGRFLLVQQPSVDSNQIELFGTITSGAGMEVRSISLSETLEETKAIRTELQSAFTASGIHKLPDGRYIAFGVNREPPGNEVVAACALIERNMKSQKIECMNSTDRGRLGPISASAPSNRANVFGATATLLSEKLRGAALHLIAVNR
jgi:hypothetical protein